MSHRVFGRVEERLQRINLLVGEAVAGSRQQVLENSPGVENLGAGLGKEDRLRTAPVLPEAPRSLAGAPTGFGTEASLTLFVEAVVNVGAEHEAANPRGVTGAFGVENDLGNGGGGEG